MVIGNVPLFFGGNCFSESGINATKFGNIFAEKIAKKLEFKIKQFMPEKIIISRKFKYFLAKIGENSDHNQGCQIFLGTKYQNGEKYTK
jgi:hypothetical protein